MGSDHDTVCAPRDEADPSHIRPYPSLPRALQSVTGDAAADDAGSVAASGVAVTASGGAPTNPLPSSLQMANLQVRGGHGGCCRSR